MTCLGGRLAATSLTHVCTHSWHRAGKLRQRGALRQARQPTASCRPVPRIVESLGGRRAHCHRRPVLVGEREEGLTRLEERGDEDRGRLVANGAGRVHDVGVIEQSGTGLEDELGARAQSPPPVTHPDASPAPCRPAGSRRRFPTPRFRRSSPGACAWGPRPRGR